jgi:hypothetical protein
MKYAIVKDSSGSYNALIFPNYFMYLSSNVVGAGFVFIDEKGLFYCRPDPQYPDLFRGNLDSAILNHMDNPSKKE